MRCALGAGVEARAGSRRGRGGAHIDAECKLHHNLQLRSRVEAPNVEGRVGLGVSELGRVGEGVRVRRARERHRREDVVGAPVDDTTELNDIVAEKVALERVDDGDTAAHGGLVAELHAARRRLVRAREELLQPRKLRRDQRLVGRHDMLTCLDRLCNHLLGEGGAAHHLDDDVDVGVIDHRIRVRDDLATGGRNPVALLVDVADHDLGHLQLDAKALLDERVLALEDLDDATTDGATANQADLDHLERGHRRREHEQCKQSALHQNITPRALGRHVRL